MNGEQIRVGVIGANPDRGWASRAHLPALLALPEYRISAVATTRAESADRAAAEFGAAHRFTDARALAEHPEVDLVTVTVKVPAHADLVGTALAAGKHVYCEWPLTRTTTEATGLLAAATGTRVHHAVGLQARFAPAAQAAKALIEQGELGRITSASIYTARSKGPADTIPEWGAYTVDADYGAGTLEVLGGHIIDLAQYLLGDLTELSAKLAVQHPRLTIAETGRIIRATSPDHVLLTAETATGTLLSLHIHDGEASDPRSRIEIAGTEGDLAILSTGEETGLDRQLPMGGLLLRRHAPSTGKWQTVPLATTGLGPNLPTRAIGVARLYQQLAVDIRTGSRNVPDFGTALRLHHLLDTVRRSAEAGTREQVMPLAA